MHYAEDFERNGYVLIPKKLDDVKVGKFRRFAEELSIALPGRRYIGYDELPNGNKILKQIIDRELISIFKEIFPNVILMPDFILQVANVPDSLLRPHYDCQSYIRYGLSKNLDNLQYAKVGFYFQPNTEQVAGSIWYVPFSHKSKLLSLVRKIPFTPLRVRLDTLVKRLLKTKQQPILTNSGDVLIFDGRLLHSSSPSRKAESKETKFAIYFSMVGSKCDAQAFMKSETYKLADEIVSPNDDDSMRINYFFGKISNELEKITNDHNCECFTLNSQFLNGTKSKNELPKTTTEVP